MTRGRDPAPVYRDAVMVASWLGRNLHDSHPIRRRALAHALDLVEWIGLALRGIDREASIDRADESLQRLRAVLHVAVEAGLLESRHLLHLADRLDRIGRQLGGWQHRVRTVS